MIVELIGDVCKRVSKKVGYNVNYIFGDSTYIREALFIQGKTPKSASKKFPLIGLYTPITEQRDNRDYQCKTNISLIIAINTLKDYTNEQRIEVSFKQILRPLYNAFIDELKSDKRLDFGYDNHVDHYYSENYAFGRRGAFDSDGKEISEKIDAIEISNLELTVKNKNCCYGRL